MAQDFSAQDWVSTIYVSYWGRAADPGGRDYWVGEFDELEAVGIADNFSESEEARSYELFASYQDGEEITSEMREAFIDSAYENLFNREPDADGKAYWVEQMEEGEATPGVMLANIVNAALVDGGDDAATLLAKKEVADAVTAKAAEEGWTDEDEIIDYLQSNQAKAFIEVTTADNVDEEKDNAVADVPSHEDPPEPGETLTLTDGVDNLQGQDGEDNIFDAPVVQSSTGFGNVTNTFETGDILDGGEDSTNILQADLISSVIGAQPTGPAISATTDNIQEVYFRVQDLASDQVTGANVDAENMNGVEQWWSENSRNDLNIEDIRSFPQDTAFGMRNTDPGVNFIPSFNPNYMVPEVIEDASFFNFTIQQTDPGIPEDTQLENITVRGLEFGLEGESYELDTEEMRAANTWDELESAVANAFADTEGLEDLEVNHEGGGLFVVRDPDAGAFEVTPDTVAVSFSDIDVRNVTASGQPVEEGLIQTDIILDNAGNGSQGGGLNINAMSGDRGVEVGNVAVDNTSHILFLGSTNDRTGDNYMEVANISHVEDGAQGDLTIGNTDPDSTDGRAFGGLLDFREVNAQGFQGELNVGVDLAQGFASDLISSYFERAEEDEDVEFIYQGGDAGNIFTIAMDQALSQDPAFVMEVSGGAEDDRFNFANVHDFESISIDGQDGWNTLEVETDIGVDEASSPELIENIHKLVLAGNNNPDATMTDLGDIEELWVATDANNDSNITNLSEDTDIWISGKNQTLADSDSDQVIGDVTLTNAQAQEQLVTLDNTARSTGELTLNSLNVVSDEDEDGVSSNVESLVVDSEGIRETHNTVNAVVAPLVSEVYLQGSQDLDITINDMAQDEDDADEGVNADIDGTALEADLALTLDSGFVTRSNASDNNVDIIGPEDRANDLTFIGEGADITNDTTVTNFPVVNFGNQAFSGTVDVENFHGVDIYNMVNLGGAATLENMADVENVLIESWVDEDITLSGDDSSEMNVELEDDDYSSVLTVNDFTTINMDLTQEDGSNYFFALSTDSNVDELFVQGGDADFLDALVFTEPLNSRLETIDVTAYDGSFEAGLDEFRGNDTEFVLDADFARLDLTGPKDYLEWSFTEWNAPGNIRTGSLDDAREAEVKITYFDADGNRLTETITTPVSEELIAETSAGDSYRFLNSLMDRVSADDKFDANMEFMFEDEDGEVGTATSISELMDFFEESRDEVLGRMEFAPNYGDGEIGIGFQVRPDKDSNLALNWLDQFEIRANDDDGTSVFYSNDMVDNADVRTVALVDEGEYTFAEDGDYQVTVNFTDYDQDEDAWQISNYIPGLTEDGVLENEDTMTLLDLSALGITEDNYEQEVVTSPISIFMDDEWEILFDGLDVEDYSLQHYEGSLFYLEGDEISVRAPLGVNVDVNDVQVAPGDVADVEFTITNNTVDAIDEEFNFFLLDANDNVVYEASQNVILDARGDSDDVSFTVDTDGLDRGDYSINAEFADEDYEGIATFTVTDDPIGEAYFEIITADFPNAVQVGESFEATVEIQNTGDAAGTRMIEVGVRGDDYEESWIEEVDLEAGEPFTDTFEFDMEDAEVGDYEWYVETEDDTEIGEFEVTEEPVVERVEIVIGEDDTYVLDDEAEGISFDIGAAQASEDVTVGTVENFNTETMDMQLDLPEGMEVDDPANLADLVDQVDEFNSSVIGGNLTTIFGTNAEEENIFINLAGVTDAEEVMIDIV